MIKLKTVSVKVIIMLGIIISTLSLAQAQTYTLGLQAGGTYEPGTIYSDADWGMLFRAKQASPNTAEFGFANSAGTNLMSVLGNGNVGIGTSNPDNKLEIKSSFNSLRVSNENVYGSDTGISIVGARNGYKVWRDLI